MNKQFETSPTTTQNDRLLFRYLRFCHSELVSKSLKREFKTKFLKYSAFTLAETLITLVIVGVVAALTVPNLVVKYQKEQTVTKLKKIYSTLQQATNKAIADYGPISTWESDTNLTKSEAAENFVKKYLLPYLNVAKYCGSSYSGNCAYSYLDKDGSRYWSLNRADIIRFYLTDGTFIAVNINNSDYNLYVISVDINGQKGPNKSGRDYFVFGYSLYNDGPNRIFPHGNSTNRAYCLKMCQKGNTGGSLCSSVIFLDGWKISDDYPW